MAALVRVATAYLVPGSTWFLVIGVGLGIVLLYGRHSAAWGRRWLISLILLYVTLGVPAVSRWMQDAVAGAVTRDARGATAIAAVVVLGNGAISIGPPGAAIHMPSVKTAFNITEAARQYRVLGRPPVVASGGIPPAGVGRRAEAEVMRDHLIALGVAAGDITLETRSTTTAEQAAHVAALLPARARVLLVTMPVHMPRAQALFRARGLDVVPAVPDVTVDGPGEPNRLVPSPRALRASVDTMHEILGLVYYRLRGDLAGS